MLNWRGKPATILLTAGALAATLGSAGCATSASAKPAPPAIEAGNGYVPTPITPGVTDAYLVIRNNGTANTLTSVTTSQGGQVSFRTPASGGLMRTVRNIGVPAGAMVRLVPDGPHLVLTGMGSLQNGKLLTLTLHFAHGQPIRVTALITNPQDTSGSNYSMN
jgi:periplasmic copper chaperone A